MFFTIVMTLNQVLLILVLMNLNKPLNASVLVFS
jgi:hypothetical protein